MSSVKRRRIVLTIEDKLEIIKKLDNGCAVREISAIYGIGEQTVRDIRKSKDKLVAFALTSNSPKGLSQRKAMKLSKYEELDNVMVLWFKKKRAEGTPVNGNMLCKQAKIFFESLGMEGDFNASNGWLTRFKKRHGIQEISTQQSEKLNAGDSKAMAEFFSNFDIPLIDAELLGMEQVYVANQTGLYWKCLPSKMLSMKQEKEVPGRNERITILCCSNVTGTHKLPLCVIGKAKTLSSFKETEASVFSVDYFSQKDAWMDQTIFTEWFTNKFVPLVQAQLCEKGLPEKAVLLLDNAPSHPHENILRTSDGSIFAKFLPPNIQSMDQGVIAALKRHYRFDLLQKCINEGRYVQVFCKNLKILDAVYGAAKAWNKIKSVTIEKSCSKILPTVRKEASSNKDEVPSADQFADIIKKSEEYANLDVRDLQEWLEIDAPEPGFQVFHEREILDNNQEGCEVILPDIIEPDEDDDFGEQLVPPSKISHEEALNAVECLLNYLEQQSDSLMSDKLVLRKLRTDIRRKKNDSEKEKSDSFQHH